MRLHAFFKQTLVFFVMSCTIMQVKTSADAIQNFLNSVPQNAQFQTAQPQGEKTLYSPLDDMAKESEQLIPTKNPEPSQKLSVLENYYKERLGFEISQFGYNHFNAQTRTSKPTGSIDSNYIIGLDDEFIISFRGQNNNVYRVRVDRQGNLILPGFQPIAAAGITFKELRDILENKTKEQFVETEAYITIGTLRSIAVFVAGEVKTPGKIQLTNLSTVLDALVTSGGVKKTGSLRHILLKRGEVTKKIDLYDLFLSSGSGKNSLVQAGDRIIVPPLKRTIALTDEVNRPAIYELAHHKEALTDILDYAGSTLRPSGNRFVVIAPDKKGIERVHEYTNIENIALRTNTIVRALPIFNSQRGGVNLTGHVRVKGVHALKKVPTLRHLIKMPETFKAEVYTLFGAIERIDPKTLSPYFIPVNFANVLEGKDNCKLKDGDNVIVLSQNDIRYLVSKDVQEVLAGKTSDIFDASRKGEASETTLQKTENSLDTGNLIKKTSFAKVENRKRGLRELIYIVSGARIGRFANAILGSSDQEKGAVAYRMSSPKIYDNFPKLLPFVLDHVISLRGEINRPGAYPITQKTNLTTLFRAANGFSREADKANVEISRFYWDSNINRGIIKRHMINIQKTGEKLYPGDVIRVSAVYTDRDDGPVLLAGEFIKPGWYDIKKGEKYSELIERAGGLGDFAYPYGAIFTRERIKNAERETKRRVLQEIQANMATAILEKDNANDVTEALKLLTQDLQNQPIIGRIIVESDPAILQTKPHLDMLMEPYDRIYMPKRPKQIMVMGEVLNPSTLQFESGFNIHDYIKKTGGYNRGADKSQTFVVLPNGEARSIRAAFWRFSDLHIPPGSTIIVPKDVSPVSILSFAKNVTPILSNLAVTAASLAVIGK